MTIKEMPKKFKNIILTGLPGSGKSTFGKIYAIHSGRYFIDFDRFFETITKKKIADVFAKEGENSFREMEQMVLKKLEKKHNYVIAMGGGTLCSEQNFEFARKLGLIVFLDTPLEVVANRLLQDANNKIRVRPLFKDLQTYEDILNQVKNLWDERKDFYEKAYIHLNTEYGSLDNLKLQLALYEKKSAERDHYKEKNSQKFQKSFQKRQQFKQQPTNKTQ
jgi:shikimate kinase